MSELPTPDAYEVDLPQSRWNTPPDAIVSTGDDSGEIARELHLYYSDESTYVIPIGEGGGGPDPWRFSGRIAPDIALAEYLADCREQGIGSGTDPLLSRYPQTERVPMCIDCERAIDRAKSEAGTPPATTAFRRSTAWTLERAPLLPAIAVTIAATGSLRMSAVIAGGYSAILTNPPSTSLPATLIASTSTPIAGGGFNPSHPLLFRTPNHPYPGGFPMLRQLDERSAETDAGRFTVRLVWDSETERTDLILISGAAPHKVARRYVVPPTRAMDAFRHPFAYVN